MHQNMDIEETEDQLVFDSQYVEIIRNEIHLYERFDRNEKIKNMFKSKEKVKKTTKKKKLNKKCRHNGEKSGLNGCHSIVRENKRQPMSEQIQHMEKNCDNSINCDYDWMVLDEWTLEDGNEELSSHTIGNKLLDDMSDSSESYELSSDYDISDNDCVSDTYNDMRNESKSSETESKPNKKYVCNWFKCEKQFSHKKCYQNHRNKHLIDRNDNKVTQFSLGFYSFNGIEEYVQVMDDNECNKYLCNFSDCKYTTVWSYQLAIHIRTEHTCFVPFLCDWFECNKVLLSQDIFAHRLTHFE